MTKEAAPQPSPYSDQDHSFINGPAGGGIEFHGGYDIQVPGGYIREPEVFSVDNIEVPQSQQGRGLGTELLKQSLEAAQHQGYGTARMDVLNPRVISIVEKLITQGVIKNAVYVPRDITERSEKVPTEKLVNSQRTLKADQAIKFTEAMEAGKAAANAQGKDAGPEYERGVMTVLELN